MTFDQWIDAVPHYRRIGYKALASWGYSREDAAHEALVAMFDLSCKGISPTGENVGGYVYRRLVNSEIDKSRRAKPLMVSADDIYSETKNPIHPLRAAKDFSVGDFIQLISPLAENRQELLFLQFVLGYTKKETAELLGLELGTVKSRSHRAATSLRGWVNAKYFIPN